MKFIYKTRILLKSFILFVFLILSSNSYALYAYNVEFYNACHQYLWSQVIHANSYDHAIACIEEIMDHSRSGQNLRSNILPVYYNIRLIQQPNN